MPPEEHTEAKFCLLGQGPGQQEAEFSQPFYPEAPSGSTLNYWLAKAGIPRVWCDIANLVWCWLPKTRKLGGPEGNRAPTKTESDFCWRAHTRPWLVARKWDDSARLIIPVGAPASRKLLGKDQVSMYMGTFNQVEI